MTRHKYNQNLLQYANDQSRVNQSPSISQGQIGYHRSTRVACTQSDKKAK